MASPETFYPDAHVESTCVDGKIWRVLGTPCESFATIRAGNGSSVNDTTTSDNIVCLNTSFGDAALFSGLIRGIFVFNTSALPDGCTITGATLSFYVTAKANSLNLPDGEASLALVNTTSTATTSVVASDFQTKGTTRLASDLSYAGITTSAHNAFTLNAAGIANISKTGLSRFITCLACDVDGSVTTTVKNTATSISARFADYTLTSYDPRLIVTYTTGGTPATVAVSVVTLSATKETPAVTGEATEAPSGLSLSVSVKTPGVVAGTSATIAVTPTSLSVTCETLTVVAGTSATVVVAPLALSVSVKTTLIQTGWTTAIPPPTLVVTSQAPVVTSGAGLTVAVTPLMLSVGCKTPGVKAALAVAVSPASFTVTQGTVTVETGGSVTINITPLALSVSAKTPSVTGIATVVVIPLAGSVTTKTPGVVAGTGLTVAVSLLSLSVSPKTPGVPAALTIAVNPLILHTIAGTVATGQSPAIVSVSPQVLCVTPHGVLVGGVRVIITMTSCINHGEFLQIFATVTEAQASKEVSFCHKSLAFTAGGVFNALMCKSHEPIVINTPGLPLPVEPGDARPHVPSPSRIATVKALEDTYKAMPEKDKTITIAEV